MNSHFVKHVDAVRALYGRVGRELILSRPATDAELERVEKKLGWSIPSGLREAWGVANGGSSYSPVFARPGFLTGYDFLSLAQAFAAREGMRKCAGGYAGYTQPEPRSPRIHKDWFAPGWLPFAGFGGGTLLLLVDMSPTAKGSAGQVIAFTHDPDQINYVAPSFDKFLGMSRKAMADAAEDMLE